MTKTPITFEPCGGTVEKANRGNQFLGIFRECRPGVFRAHVSTPRGFEWAEFSTREEAGAALEQTHELREGL